MVSLSNQYINVILRQAQNDKKIMDQQPMNQQNQPKGSPVRHSPDLNRDGGGKMGIIIVSLIGIAVLVLIVSAVVKKGNQQSTVNSQQNQNANQIEVVTSNVDTSDWKTYRNEELGVEFRYPADMLIRKGDEIDPVSGMSGNANSLKGCYFATTENGQKICTGFGGFSFELKPDAKVKTSLEAFDYIYSKNREEGMRLGRMPHILDLNRILVEGRELYQAEYFGGDSTAVQIYIPAEEGIWLFNYSVAPKENDPQTEINQQVSRAVFLSLKLR